MKYTGWVLLILLLAPAGYTLDVTVGSSFKITGITRTDGKIVLPVERKKYRNVRIENQETFSWVQACKEVCTQPLAQVTPTVQEVRPARTRANMFLVNVSFSRAWLITCLVFKHGEEYAVQFPADFVFLDLALQARTQQLIIHHVQESK